jgi:dephospho-CoA kinase
MLRVGLTGGIACGKSRVLARFAARGLSTLDLDRVAHEALAVGGAAHDEVVAAFGRGILDAHGHIDRKILGRTVFGDIAARARLNAIVHPKVRDAESCWAEGEMRRGVRIAVTDAALLVESGVHLRFDRLVVVHCPGDEQIRRLMSRDGVDATAARARIDAQMPVEEKRRFGHLEIDTSRGLSDTDRAADAAVDTLEGVAADWGTAVAVPTERALGALTAWPTRAPRGLSPLPFLEAIAAWGSLEMERAAGLLVPARDGPWYRQGGGGASEPAAAVLAAPLVLWALHRGAPDPDYLASASASLARLTHSDGGAVADAVAVALALQHVLVDGRAPARGWATPRQLGERWGRAPSAPGIEAQFAPLLVVAARGVPEAEAPAEALRALRAIEAMGR